MLQTTAKQCDQERKVIPLHKPKFLFIIFSLSRLHYRLSELCQNMVNIQVQNFYFTHKRANVLKGIKCSVVQLEICNQLSRFLHRNLHYYSFFCISASFSEKYKESDKAVVLNTQYF